MKRVFLTSISGIWILISTVIAVHGQLASNHIKPSDRFIVSNKKESENPAVGVGRVNPPVVRSFLKAYKDVSDEKWIEVTDGFVAMFTYNGRDYQVAYTKRGNLVHTIRSYNEDKMAPELRHLVKSTYYDYNINRVHEIEIPRDPITYVVQLEGKKELINLKVYEGEMEEIQKFNKSK